MTEVSEWRLGRPSDRIDVPFKHKFRPPWRDVVRLPIDQANACVYLGPGSGIHTRLGFDTFFGSDHTLAGWFMPQYVYGDDGPVFASADGRFLVGQGDYQRGTRWTGSITVAGDPLLTVVVDGARSLYRAPTWQPGTWHHLACVREGATLKLCLDGDELEPVKVGAAQAADGQKVTTPAARPTVPGGFVPAGHLVLGRCDHPDKLASAQAYGLLDDVAVFDHALTPADLASLVADKRTGGYESGLLAGWGFDHGKAAGLLPPRLRGATTEYDITVAKVSADRDDDADAPLLDHPWVYAGSTPGVAFPFPKGEAWRVMQGMNDPVGSHIGYAAFCLDLALAGKERWGEYPDGTRHAPVYAVNSAYVMSYLRDGAQKDGREPNKIRTVNGNGDTITYLHLAADSLSEDVVAGDHSSTMKIDLWPSTTRTVTQFEKIAELGPGAAHLHIAGGELYFDAQHPFGTASAVTTPFGFDDVEVRPGGTGDWVTADPCYIPRQGDWLRRT